MSEKIDAHHHLWRYHPGEYPWIGEHMTALRRDFLVPDLEQAVLSTGVSGTIAVQARQSLAETAWLLAVADESPMIRGVVGWTPIASRNFGAEIEWLCAQRKLKGLRHVIQDEPDDNYILSPEFNRGIALLKSTSLVYDILIAERHLAAAIDFVDAHPNQVFVLDHAAKPRIREGVMEPWRYHLSELAKRENVYCKLSGLVTEADWVGWTVNDLSPFTDLVLEAFGAERTMFGSDWPVCLLATTYTEWHTAFQSLITELSATEREQVLGLTAANVYHLQTGGWPNNSSENDRAQGSRADADAPHTYASINR